MPRSNMARESMQGVQRVADDDRHDRRVVAHAGVQAALLGQLQEQPRVGLQPLATRSGSLCSSCSEARAAARVRRGQAAR